ncbi:integrase_H2C2 domain-containing protein [Trichonephila clavipes]|nr:integrase_H2C2 domain-containing protein [Trichonephila clavipes]
MKKAWDHELPQNIVNKFMKWFNEIQILIDVTVPRCMKIDIFTELHVFVDASKGSYAGCVFARSIVDSRVSVILVRAKSRVAPLKLLSITRLELMACCVGARLVNSILKALNMPDLKVTLWSDSTTALWWVKEYLNWSVFVANRCHGSLVVMAGMSRVQAKYPCRGTMHIKSVEFKRPPIGVVVRRGEFQLRCRP